MPKSQIPWYNFLKIENTLLLSKNTMAFQDLFFIAYRLFFTRSETVKVNVYLWLQAVRCACQTGLWSKSLQHRSSKGFVFSHYLDTIFIIAFNFFHVDQRNEIIFRNKHPNSWMWRSYQQIIMLTKKVQVNIQFT